MSNRTLPAAKIPLDPLFQPPLGSEDNFIHTDVVRTVQTVQQNPNALGFGDGSLTPGPTESEFYMATPEGLAVIDQKLRRAPGGQQVVDIVVQCLDVVGALEYEVQIVKT